MQNRSGGRSWLRIDWNGSAFTFEEFDEGVTTEGTFADDDQVRATLRSSFPRTAFDRILGPAD